LFTEPEQLFAFYFCSFALALALALNIEIDAQAENRAIQAHYSGSQYLGHENAG